jgi:hypothetical protein
VQPGGFWGADQPRRNDIRAHPQPAPDLIRGPSAVPFPSPRHHQPPPPWQHPMHLENRHTLSPAPPLRQTPPA